jgi:hypothetical protein
MWSNTQDFALRRRANQLDLFLRFFGLSRRHPPFASAARPTNLSLYRDLNCAITVCYSLRQLPPSAAVLHR